MHISLSRRAIPDLEFDIDVPVVSVQIGWRFITRFGWIFILLTACAYTPSELRENGYSLQLHHLLEPERAAITVAEIELGGCGGLTNLHQAVSVEPQNASTWIVTIGDYSTFPDEGRRNVRRVYDVTRGQIAAFWIDQKSAKRVEEVFAQLSRCSSSQQP